jgi:hypothetical protein
LDEDTDEKNILVFHLGGDTFDVSLVKRESGVFKVVATNGNTNLGGEDFDQRVMEYFIELFKNKTGKDVRKDDRAVQKLRREVEKVKRTLSSQQQAKIEVRRLLMNDTRPFEHQFFKLTSHSFPLLKKLTICNAQPQKDKEHSLTLIIFPYLILLDLARSHTDYAEQFLLAKNTQLPCLLDLCIRYESLTMLTNNFIIHPMRLNCTQIKKLHIKSPFVRPKTFHKYFPLL